jgi:uncharacterized LabA/DUF88 family protein
LKELASLLLFLGRLSSGPSYEGLYFFEEIMDRVAVFVDAGYLYAGGSTALCGKALKRSELSLNVPAVVQHIRDRASSMTGVPLPRIYWYDGALGNRLTTDHQLPASSDGVKLRLGIINGFGEQKGVDAKIITDIADLARNNAFCDAVLIGGDEDLRIGVELAQERGARVHLLTIESSASSSSLRQEADTVSVITAAEVETFLSIVVSAASHPLVVSPSVPIRESDDETSDAENGAADRILIAAEVATYLAALSPEEHAALRSAMQVSSGVPTEHDGRLLARSRVAIARQLDQPEKTYQRQELRRQIGLP